MSQPVRVLLVFEKEEDALRIVRELESGGYEPTQFRVGSSRAALAALEGEPWDLIVAESRLWRSFGSKVRKSIRERDPTPPLLIVPDASEKGSGAMRDTAPIKDSEAFLARVGRRLASAAEAAKRGTGLSGAAPPWTSPRKVLSLWRRYLPLMLTLAAGAALSVALFFLVRGIESSQLRSDFNTLAADRSYSLRSGLAEDSSELRFLASFIETSSELKQGAFDTFGVEFRQFIAGIPVREPDTQIVAFVDRVPFAERALYEERARRGGDPDFVIRDLGEGGDLQPAGRRSEYFPITIVEPRNRNAALAGLDLSTVPELRQAIAHAVQSGKMTATGRVNMPPFPEEAPIVWMLLPAFGNGNTEGRLIGLAAYAFRIDQMVEFSLKDLSPAGIDLELSDPTAPANQRLLYFHRSRTLNPGSPSAAKDAALSWSTTIEAGEREWTLRAFPTSGFIAHRRGFQSWTLLAGGILLTTFGGIFVSSRMRRTFRIERLVAERTRDLSRQIAKHRRLEEALHKSRAALTSRVSELDQRNREIRLLNEVGDLLEACLSTNEAFPVISLYAPRLLPGTAGALYMHDAAKGVLTEAARWGDDPPSVAVFRPEDCWALRRGRAHSMTGAIDSLPCPHASPESGRGSICVPLAALGETIGLFHVVRLREDAHAFATSIAEHTGLALSNLKLRSDLQQLSIHDPLTGLYNRRYMEEALELELHRAERKKVTVGVVMLDIDHFKAFNDGFGHAAGDELLKALGALARARLRAGDIACRFGGEEFVLILPEASLEATREKAEDLRAHVKALDVRILEKRLGLVSISLGVAIAPDHGHTRDELLRVADAALYRAKGEGRDRVIVADLPGEIRK